MNLEEQIKLIVENSGLKLYDIVTTKEHERNIFRVIVTSKDGVNLDKCAEISNGRHCLSDGKIWKWYDGYNDSNGSITATPRRSSRRSSCR